MNEIYNIAGSTVLTVTSGGSGAVAGGSSLVAPVATVGVSPTLASAVTTLGAGGGIKLLSSVKQLGFLLDKANQKDVERLTALVIAVRVAHETFRAHMGNQLDSGFQRKNLGQQLAAARLYDKLAGLSLEADMVSGDTKQFDAMKKFVRETGVHVLRDLIWSWDRGEALSPKRAQLLKNRDKELRAKGFLTPDFSVPRDFSTPESLFSRYRECTRKIKSLEQTLNNSGRTNFLLSDVVKLVDLTSTAAICNSIAVLSIELGLTESSYDVSKLLKSDIKLCVATLSIIHSSSLVTSNSTVHLSTMKNLFSTIRFHITN